MSTVSLTNSFRIRSMSILADLKAKKIQTLKELTYTLTTEKYPLYKQLNNSGDLTMKAGINKIRALCADMEKKINSCGTEEELALIIVSEPVLRRYYEI